MTYEITEAKFLSEKEQERLREAFSLKPDKSLPLRLLLETGARGQELLNVVFDDVDFKGGSIFIRGLKGSRDRRIPLKPETLLLLKKRCQGLSGQDQIFAFSTRTLRRLWGDFRPCSKGVHALRHTFALNVYEAHTDIILLKSALGHKNIKNTMVYADFIERMESLKKILDVA